MSNTFAKGTPMVMIGFGNSVSAAHVIAVVAADSAPVKRMVQEAKAAGTLIDATCGRRMRTVLAMDSAHVVLSALTAETITARLDPGVGDRAGDGDE